MSGSDGSLDGVRSHDAALALEEVRVLVTESLFGSVFLQVCQLFAVDGAAALPGKEEKHDVSGKETLVASAKLVRGVVGTGRSHTG